MGFAFGNRFDQDKSINGVWVTYDGDEDVLGVPEAERPRFLVTRLDAPEIRRALLQERERMMRGKGGRQLTGVDQNELLARHLSRNVLRDWANVVDFETGEPIPYSPEAAYRLIEEDGRFRAWIDAKSSEAELFYRERVGNSGKRSRNASSGA